MIAPTIIFTFFIITFSALDGILFSRTCLNPSIPYEEWRANGWARFLPGSGFYLAWKYRNR